MARCFPCALDFAKVTTRFLKSTGADEFRSFYISPVKSLNLVLIRGGKVDEHRGTWTGCLHQVNKEDSDSPHSLLAFLGEVVNAICFKVFI